MSGHVMYLTVSRLMSKCSSRLMFGIKRQLHSTPILFNLTNLNSVPIDKTRNIGIIAHIDAGKTTTTERMLFYSGKTRTIGNVDEGDTVTDFLPSERERGITIQLAAITIPWHNNKINIIDTPGHVDFTFEVIRSLRVLDGCVTILDGVAGVEAQTEKVWKQALGLGIPKVAYVNKMDREGAGFSRTVQEIIQKLQTRVVLCTVPYFKVINNEPKFCGVIDIIDKVLLEWDFGSDPNGKKVVVTDLASEKGKHPEQFDILCKSRESMVETLGEFDEAIIDSFLENNEDYLKIPPALLNAVIRKATISNYLVPVYCGSSFKNIGVQPLMDAIVKYLPSPVEITTPEVAVDQHSNVSRIRSKKKSKKSKTHNLSLAMDTKRGLIVNSNANLTLALAFKVFTHPTRGTMTFFRVYSGKLTSNTQVINTRTGKKLTLKKLWLMHGDQPEVIPLISSGNIGVITGTEDEIVTGDTLVSHGPSNKAFSELETSLKMHPIEIPPPLFNAGIEPRTAGDLRYMNECIQVLLREDPSLSVSVDEDLGQTIISGMGELHLDIVKDRLVNDLKANVTLKDVVVSYKETVARPDYQVVSFATGDDASVEAEILLDSFEGQAEDTIFAGEEGALVLEQDNNIIILEPTATPASFYQTIEERRWKSEYSLENLQDTLIQGCMTALLLGGPIFGLPLHSTVIRLKKWLFPVDDKKCNSSLLLEAGRKAVSKAIKELHASNENNFCILEPIMLTKVYVNSDVLGEVVHDLHQKCLATITSIEDDTDNLDSVNWAHTESDKVYLPPDYTLSTNSLASSQNVKNQKVIVAETPLKEMIGYLSRLRSISQGRGIFDMTYMGMKRATKSRLSSLSGDI